MHSQLGSVSSFGEREREKERTPLIPLKDLQHVLFMGCIHWISTKIPPACCIQFGEPILTDLSN